MGSDRRSRWGPSLVALALGVGVLGPAAASDAATQPLAAPPREIAFVLDGPAAPSLTWLLPFRDASVERHGPMRLYEAGPWGQWLRTPWSSYAWDPRLGLTEDEERRDSGPDDASVGSVRTIAPPAEFSPVQLGGSELQLVGLLPTASAARRLWWADGLLGRSARAPGPTFETSGPNLSGDGFDGLYLLPPTKPVPDWRCRRRPVTLVRYGAEQDTFELVRCDGTVPPLTQDRLTILARPPDVPRPGDTLPDEPDAVAWSTRREWLPSVRLVHPRLLWALQRLADEFPRRAIYLVSGYRPGARVGGGTMDDPAPTDPGLWQGHRSLHADGRALDLHIHGVRNEDVLAACRMLRDVGCGYYPNSTFIHLDVRRAHTGKAFWIDASAPGEPSRYVDSWPGVADAGAMSWAAPQHRTPGP